MQIVYQLGTAVVLPLDPLSILDPQETWLGKFYLNRSIKRSNRPHLRLLVIVLRRRIAHLEGLQPPVLILRDYKLLGNVETANASVGKKVQPDKDTCIQERLQPCE